MRKLKHKVLTAKEIRSIWDRNTSLDVVRLIKSHELLRRQKLCLFGLALGDQMHEEVFETEKDDASL